MYQTICILTCIACSMASIAAQNTQIIIETALVGEITGFGIAGSGTATIDWGDGSDLQTVTLTPLPEKISEPYIPDKGTVSHSYFRAGTKTVTVSGNITALYTGQTRAVIAIDAGRMPGLKMLTCFNERIETVDVSENTELVSLVCDNNRLNSIDVSKNTALTQLWCSNTGIETLDVSKNTVLRELSCTNNRLDSLDVSKNTALTYLFCNSNSMNRKALVDILSALPPRAAESYAAVLCSGNPGHAALTAADKAIATNKKWLVK